jgi:peptidyl-prolyl cis-trans isomerase D
MMQLLRNRVKLVYWVVITAFIAFAFLVWGVGFEKGRGQKEHTTVASIDGVDVAMDTWRERVRVLTEQMQQQRGEQQEPLSDNQLIHVRQQAFDDLVTETLLDQQVKKMKITVTDAEIADVLRNDPPPYLLALYRDDKGNIDYDAYNRDLQESSPRWRQALEYLRQTLPLQKLEQHITDQAVVGEAELREAFAEQSVKAVAEYVTKPYADVPVPDGQIQDDQISAYYNQHKEEYNQPARAAVKLVTLPAQPSAEDDADVLSVISDIRKELVEKRTTFADAATTYSEDPSAKSGGDLGFFDREKMVAPFTDAAFKLPVGQISEPVRTQFGYHLILVTDEKLDTAKTVKKGAAAERSEVRASHILLKVRPSQTTLVSLREKADACLTDAATMGLDEAAKKLGLTVTVTPPFQDSFNIPGVPNSLPGTRFAFSNPVGTMSPVYQNDDMVYFFQVGERLPAGVRSLEEVKPMITAEIQRDQRAEQAAAALNATWAKLKEGRTLELVAKETGLTYGRTDTFTYRQQIKDIGFASPFAKAALSLEPGQTISDVRTPRGTYIVKLLWKSAFDEEAFKKKRSELSQSLLFSRQRQMLDQWLKQLKESAKIVDNRTPDLL